VVSVEASTEAVATIAVPTGARRSLPNDRRYSGANLIQGRLTPTGAGGSGA
jgi:hypothetical protein